MAWDEIRSCPNCNALVYDRCDCGWEREEYTLLAKAREAFDYARHRFNVSPWRMGDYWRAKMYEAKARIDQAKREMPDD